MSEKIIFTDIDGVLIPINYEGTSNHGIESKIAIQKFKEIIKETRAKVVITSSWRIGAMRPLLKEFFIKNDIPLPIGYTPLIQNGNMRDLEICKFIVNFRKKYSISHFAILDDNQRIFKPNSQLRQKVVFTDMEIGLSEENKKQVLTLLDHHPQEEEMNWFNFLKTKINAIIW